MLGQVKGISLNNFMTMRAPGVNILTLDIRVQERTHGDEISTQLLDDLAISDSLV